MGVLPVGETIVFASQEGVSFQGVNAINYWLQQFVPSELVRLPDWWCWEWLSQDNKEYQGRLPTRISKWLRVTYDVKLNTDQLSNLGYLAHNYLDHAGSYIFDFDQRFSWDAGDFGDDDSCYWGGRNAARQILRDEGAYALRFFDDSEWGGRSGFARCWLAPVLDDCFVAFNGYGMDLLDQTRILAGWRKHHFCKVDLTNHGLSRGMLWINNASGYLIGPEETIQSVGFLDLEWPEHFTCSRCQQYKHELMAHEQDGSFYCQHCFDLMEKCFGCGCLNDHVRLSLHDGESHCPSCMNYLFNLLFCSRCDTWKSGVGFNGSFCSSCWDELPPCHNCGRRCEMACQGPDGLDYCRGCASNLFLYCDGCHKYHLPTDTRSYHWDFLCNDCYEARGLPR